MKILLIGASGMLGKAVDAELCPRHEIVRASRKADLQVDISNPASIRAMFAGVGPVDAVACAAGHVVFAPLAELTPEKYAVGLNDKLMGQVNLVLLGMANVRTGGSFTLVSGVLSRDPIRAGSSASMVNGALDAFVRAAAIELPRGLRINSVSPTVFEEAMPAYGPFFPGFKPVPVAQAALAFAKSIEGARTGHTFFVE